METLSGHQLAVGTGTKWALKLLKATRRWRDGGRLQVIGSNKEERQTEKEIRAVYEKWRTAG